MTEDYITTDIKESKLNWLRNALDSISYSGQLSPIVTEKYRAISINDVYQSQPLGPYFIAFSKEINILSDSYKPIENIGDPEMTKRVIEVLRIFQSVISLYKDELEEVSSLPPLTINNLDDGSVLIEWIFTDFRIGISLEENYMESSWYLVSNSKLEGISYSGALSIENLQFLITILLQFVASYS